MADRAGVLVAVVGLGVAFLVAGPPTLLGMATYACAGLALLTVFW